MVQTFFITLYNCNTFCPLVAIKNKKLPFPLHEHLLPYINTVRNKKNR